MVVTVSRNKEEPARCPVRLHIKYMSLRPSDSQDFYIRPLKYPKPDIWYAATPLGRHVLSGAGNNLCIRAVFEGFYTNHSLRATTATRLYEEGLDEQRSTAIRSYKRTSCDMLKLVDDVVQRKKRATAATWMAPNPDTQPMLEMPMCTTASDSQPMQFVVERNGARITF